jgi:hypothetical protein
VVDISNGDGLEKMIYGDLPLHTAWSACGGEAGVALDQLSLPI